MTIQFELNGTRVETHADQRETLRDVLRDELDQKGVKVGCLSGRCGVCTVLVDGVAVKSCIYLANKADGKSVTTIHGLTDGDGGLHEVQESFDENFAYQCGYCTPGFIMTAVGFLENDVDDGRDVTRDEIRQAMKGTLCRCTGYVKIVDAVEQVANRDSEPT